MGHEIGHVTGRHSASQMSKQQLAMGGLVLGMAVRPELAAFAGLAQPGLGLLFLKFGRDDENEADDLGLRYMTREDYDPRQMVSVMGMLDRVTREAGGSGMPDWLSTHPNPENRAARIQTEIATTSVSGSVVRRAEYLRRVDGMVFGENPREGFFQGNAFFHPDLRFRMTFPASFKTQNDRQAVAGVSEAQDAAIALTLAKGASAQDAARLFLAQEGIRAGRSGRERIGGLPAYTATFEAATQEGALRGEVAFVEHARARLPPPRVHLGFARLEVPGGLRGGDAELRPSDRPPVPGRPAPTPGSRQPRPRHGPSGVQPRLPLDRQARDDRDHQRRRRRPEAPRRRPREAGGRRPAAGLVPGSEPRGLERVAGGGVAALQALPQPAHAHLGRPVRPGLRGGRRPAACFWIMSSPIAAAARRPSSTSPGSRYCWLKCP